MILKTVIMIVVLMMMMILVVVVLMTEQDVLNKNCLNPVICVKTIDRDHKYD
jgi:hypothetical protein